MADILLMIGRNIKRFRSKHGFSQEKLAELSGLHRTYIGSVERGERNISLLNLEKIANALGVHIQSMLDSSSDATEEQFSQ